MRPSFSKIILLLESFAVDGGQFLPDDLIKLGEDECEKTLMQTVDDDNAPISHVIDKSSTLPDKMVVQ